LELRGLERLRNPSDVTDVLQVLGEQASIQKGHRASRVPKMHAFQ
jgi:hypothetical protein